MEKFSPWGSEKTFSRNVFIPIRMILALVVIWSHCFPIVHGTNSPEPLFQVTRGEYTFGDLAVCLFLAISGFLVAHSWERSRTTHQFVWKRVLRVYPAFVVLMLLQAFVLAPLATREPFRGYSLRQVGLIAFETVDLVSYGFPYGGLLNVFPDTPHPHEMNGSLWTVRYEFVCYALLALAGRGFFRRPILLVGLLVLVSTLWASGWLPPWNPVLTALVGSVNQWPRVLSFFFAGVCFYRLRKLIPYDGRFALACLALIVITAFVSSTALRAVLPAAGTYLLLWVAYHPRVVSLRLPNYADYSYGTYLYAFPIQQSLMFWVSPHLTLDVFRLGLLASVLAVGMGAVSWYVVERPLLRLKGKTPELAGAVSPSSLKA